MKTKPTRGSLAKLAKTSGIPYGTLSRWKREGTDIFNAEALAERMARIKQAPCENITQARLLKLQLEAERLQLQLDVERGKFVCGATMKTEGIRIGGVIGSTLDRLAQELPPQLAGRTAPEIAVILKRVFRETRSNLAKYQSPIKFDNETES
jgi:hypothetical protein